MTFHKRKVIIILENNDFSSPPPKKNHESWKARLLFFFPIKMCDKNDKIYVALYYEYYTYTIKEKLLISKRPLYVVAVVVIFAGLSYFSSLVVEVRSSAKAGSSLSVNPSF